LKGEEVQLLKQLAAAGGDHAAVVLTSREAGERIGVSQQAADRYLMALDREGYLTRTLGARKQRLLLTPLAIELLRKEYHGYRRIFEGPAKVQFRGTVSSGLGEGRYYLSQPGYMVQFSERLGYSPFPGTLNVRVGPEDLLKVGSVKHWTGIRIDGFQASGRTFGGATCYPARLGGRDCHLIIPDRTHHQDVVEFISAESLRESLHLKDGGPLDVEIREA
jgi:riboflavin kinase